MPLAQTLDRRLRGADRQGGRTWPTPTPAGRTRPSGYGRSFDERSGYRTKSILTVPMRDHKGEVIGVVQLINKKRDAQARLHAGARSTAEVVPVQRGRRGAGHLAGQPGGGRVREHAAHRGHPAPVRLVRQRVGHRDREPRPHHLGPLGAGGAADGRPGRADGRARERALPRRALHPRPAAGDPLREPAARLRQGRRAREGADQGQEALRGRDAGDPPALRLHPAHAGGRALQGAARRDCARAGPRPSSWPAWSATTRSACAEIERDARA